MTDSESAESEEREKQTELPTAKGWVNVSSDTWHYLKRCAGVCRSISRVSLQDAVEDDLNICGVCAARFDCYTERDGGSR